MIGKTLLTSSTPDVHVDAPDHHVAAPPLGALDELVVARLVGDLLVVPLRERVAARAQQLDVHRVGDGAHGGDRVGDVVDGCGDGVADAARDLDGVGEQLAGDRVALERGALLEHVDDLGGARHEVARRAVGEHQLPLESHRRAGGCREGHRHSHSLTWGCRDAADSRGHERKRAGVRGTPAVGAGCSRDPCDMGELMGRT